MICSIVLLILVGVLLEGLPSLNVLAPLLIPIAGKLGLSELHYALVLIIAMGIGGFMPFAGVGFYVCCAVMRCDIETASRAMLPYLIMLHGRTADRGLRAMVHAAPAPLFRLSRIRPVPIRATSNRRTPYGPQRFPEDQRRRCRPDDWPRPTSPAPQPSPCGLRISPRKATRRTSPPSSSPARSRSAPTARSRSRSSRTTSSAGRRNRRSRSSSAPSTWACRPRASSTNMTRPSPPSSFPSSSTARRTRSRSSMGRRWIGWRRWRKSRVLCCCGTGNTASATSPTACGRSIRPTT